MSRARCEGLGHGVVKPREMDRRMDKRGTRTDKWRERDRGTERKRERDERDERGKRRCNKTDHCRVVGRSVGWMDGRMGGRTDG